MVGALGLKPCGVPYGDTCGECRDSCDDPLYRAEQTVCSLAFINALLRRYVAHQPKCVLSFTRSPLADSSWCSCGLIELLSAIRPPSLPPDSAARLDDFWKSTSPEDSPSPEGTT